VPDLLRHFLVEEVRASTHPNGDLTTGELVEVLVAYCELYALRMPPVSIVRKYLPKIMLEVHGVPNSHSIRQDGRWRRGFHHVEWRPCEDHDESPSVPQDEDDSLVPEVTL